jgi:hypothetical protein
MMKSEVTMDSDSSKNMLMQVVKYAFNVGQGGAAPEALDFCSRYIYT